TLWGSCALVVTGGLACVARAPSPASSSATSLALPKGPLARLEQSLVFAPRKYPEGEWNLPAGAPIEHGRFAGPHGPKLHGWYCSCENPRAVVLYCHGNAGNITSCVEVLAQLRALGACALAFDYRGYGKSEGTPDEAGILADARAARAWLAQRTGVA